MIINSEDAIKKHIKSNNKARVYLVYGDENYLVNHYADSLASSVADTSGMSFNYYAFDPETVQFDAVYEACETIPVMSDKICVLIKDFPFMKTDKDTLQLYLDYIPKIPDTTVLIFRMSTVEVDAKKNPKWTPILDLFNRNGAVICIQKRTESEIVTLIIRSAKSRNANISGENAEYFLSVVGSEMNIMRSELDKLCSYADGKEITKEMIDAVAVKSTEASVFDLTDAVNGQKNDRAFEILSELIKEKTDPTIILGTIAFSYVDIYRAKIAETNGGNINDFLPAFSNYKNSNFRLRKASASAKKLTLKQIKELIEAVSQADIKIKSFSVDNNVILEELLAKLLYITGGSK